MRLIATPLLAALALLLASSTAHAYRVDMAAFLNGSPYAGEALNVGDIISVEVTLDTEGAADIALLGVGVLFDESSFTYRQDLSVTTSYLLYTGPKTPYLIADPSCGGYPTTGACGIYPTRSNQVQVGFLSNSLPSGVPNATADDASVGGPVLHTAVFEVTNTAAGTASFDFDFDGFFGSILQLGDTSNPPLTLGPSAVVTLPEPSVGLLSLGAIVTVAAIRRHRKSA
jgi:hypothetical protein